MEKGIGIGKKALHSMEIITEKVITFIKHTGDRGVERKNLTPLENEKIKVTYKVLNKLLADGEIEEREVVSDKDGQSRILYYYKQNDSEK